MVNVARELKSHLSDDLLELITEAGKLAAAKKHNLYLVGGVVRDIFLGRPVTDADLVLEGDAPSLARELGILRKGKVVVHSRFGTATVKQDHINIDIVTARSETYSRPGALPSVKPGTVDDDLFRRDFTINAMAICILPECFGELIDPHGGGDDLDRHIIRVLHEKSFRDDPTRIWRAVRYEQRLDFILDEHTEELLRRDLDMIYRVSGDRLRHEIERILEEQRPEKVLHRAHELGALQRLSPSLRGDDWLIERCKAARSMNPSSGSSSIIYLALSAWLLTKEETENFIHMMRFSGEQARVLRDTFDLKQNLQLLEARELLPSQIYSILEPYHVQSIKAAAIATDSTAVKQHLNRYLSELIYITSSLNGNDLKRLGIKQGKKMGEILRSLKAARLDGKVTTREEEEVLVKRWLGEGDS